jgi:hypothetical protein
MKGELFRTLNDDMFPLCVPSDHMLVLWPFEQADGYVAKKELKRARSDVRI